MATEVLLTVKGTQTIDGDTQQLELTTLGSFDEAEDRYVFRYTEEQEPPYKPVNVTVNIFKDLNNVEMIRSGAFDSCLLIQKSKRNLCQYATEFGNIMMGVYGIEFGGKADTLSGEFSFGYDLDINGSHISKNTVQMSFKKMENSKDVADS